MKKYMYIPFIVMIVILVVIAVMAMQDNKILREENDTMARVTESQETGEENSQADLEEEEEVSEELGDSEMEPPALSEVESVEDIDTVLNELDSLLGELESSELSENELTEIQQ